VISRFIYYSWTMCFHFVPIRRSDFALLSQWLATAHVARWWDDDPALDAIESDYGGCVDGTEPCEVFIAQWDGRPIGLIQRYRFGAYPQYAMEMAHIMDVAPECTSIDYLVGPPDALGKGWGSAMIAAMAARIWEDDPGTPRIIVPVQADNQASWRALERAGFVRVAEGELAPDNPADRPAHFIYSLGRPTPAA